MAQARLQRSPAPQRRPAPGPAAHPGQRSAPLPAVLPAWLAHAGPAFSLSRPARPQNAPQRLLQRVRIGSVYTELDEKKRPKPFWSKPSGYRFEDREKATVRGTEPVFDSVEGSTAVSLKTFDLVRHYALKKQGPTEFDQASFEKALRDYIRQVINWPRGYKPVKIKPQKMKKKVLRIALPRIKRVWPQVHKAVTESIKRVRSEAQETNAFYMNKGESVPIDLEVVTDSSLFTLSPGYKYEKWEQASIGGKEPGNTKTIDDWDPKSGIARSLKTFDLARNYQDEKGVDRFIQRINEFYQALIDFGYSGNEKIKPQAIAQVVLQVAIPPLKLIEKHNTNGDALLDVINRMPAQDTITRNDGSTYQALVKVTQIGSYTEYGGLLSD